MSNLEKVAPIRGLTPVELLKQALVSEQTNLARRFRALFALKHIASTKPPTSEALEAIKAISAAFNAKSALLKHELAYCLGQTQNFDAVPFLTAELENPKVEPIVRHEAAEALGALGHVPSIPLLEKVRDDPNECIPVRETCDLAVDRIKWSAEKKQLESLHESDFGSIDPAPILPDDAAHRPVAELEADLLNPKLSLFQRYRTMFALRELASPEDAPTAAAAIKALTRGFEDKSALFKHEVAFVFGQLSNPAAIPVLMERVKDTQEADIVRHEAAEALGSLGENEGVEDFLKQYIEDPEPVVRESCIVALDMAAFERSGDFEYTLETPAVAAVSA